MSKALVTTIRMSMIVIFLINNYAVAAEQSGKSDERVLKKQSEFLSTFLQNNCINCHGSKKQKGDVRLDTINPDIANHADVAKWQDILDVLNTGDMPPKEEKRPNSNDLQNAIGIITDNVQDAHKRLAATGGVIKMRHLTKREYLGSIADLFGADVPRDILPNDVSAGFDTNGSNQFFSLKQYEDFYGAGKEIVKRNIKSYLSPLPKPTAVRHDPEIIPYNTAKMQYEQLQKVMELIDAKAPITEIIKVDPKVADEGQIKLFVKRFPDKLKGLQARYETFKDKQGIARGFSYSVNVTPCSLYEFSINAEEVGNSEAQILVNNKNIGSVKFLAGQKQSSKILIPIGLFDSTITISVNGSRESVFDYATMSGPYANGKREISFFESIVKSVVQNEKASNVDIATMLTKFADRAFRYQGVDDSFISGLMNTYQLERKTGKSVADAIIEPLTAIISAPAFLYIKEKNDGVRKVLSQSEFAIRLSYFLWGAPPDQELYELVKKNKLTNKTELIAQCERMLASPKADIFLTDFINQWSHMNRFDEIDLPVNLIRNGFVDSARQELSEFFKVLVRENLPLDNFIKSDFVVVNQRLAQYYGLKVRATDNFQKYSIPQTTPRGGILTQAAFLIMGTSGARTSPTIRGMIIRENFLNDTIPPPPPDVPAIEQEKSQKLTVKQLVERHKNIPQCASCHNKIDPVGYGLENFDYLGNWRASEVLGEVAMSGKRPKKNEKAKVPETVTINASGYVGANQFNDFIGLQKVLLQNKDKLAQSIYESLLSYSIGRDLEFVDSQDVTDQLGLLKKNNYPLKEMIIAIISSKTFATK